MGRSRFCLAPRGITPWTIHLFVSMLAGCIPVPCRWSLVVVGTYEDLEMDECWVPELMTYSPYSWHGWYSHQACHYYGIRIMPYRGYTGMWCACAFACKKKRHVAEVVSALFSHTSAIFTYNKGLWMIGSCPSWHADGTLALASQQVILSDDLEAPFQDLLDWSSSAIAMRALTAKRKTHSGIELKQTTLNFYSQSTVNTSIQTLDRWSKPRFFDQMANRSS